MSISVSLPASRRAMASRRWCGVSLRGRPNTHAMGLGALAALAGAGNDQVALELGQPRSGRNLLFRAQDRGGAPIRRRRAAGLTVVSVVTRARGGEHHADPP